MGNKNEASAQSKVSVKEKGCMHQSLPRPVPSWQNLLSQQQEVVLKSVLFPGHDTRDIEQVVSHLPWKGLPGGAQLEKTGQPWGLVHSYPPLVLQGRVRKAFSRGQATAQRYQVNKVHQSSVGF